MKIESFQNPKIKQLVKLKNRSERNKTGLFLIEGYRECTRAMEGKVPFQSLFYSKELFLGEGEMRLIDSFEGPKYSVSKEIFQKISYRDRPDGLLALAPQVARSIEELEAILENSESPLICIAEAIEKPGNLGSILRSCDAAGVDAVIVVDRCTDIFNPNVVRSSVGTLFTLPTFELESGEVLDLLDRQNIRVISATPEAETLFTKCEMGNRTAIVVGTEQYGLTDQWKSRCHKCVSIPMHGAADSLNVANATTLLLYEALRQRLEIK